MKILIFLKLLLGLSIVVALDVADVEQLGTMWLIVALLIKKRVWGGIKWDTCTLYKEWEFILVKVTFQSVG